MKPKSVFILSALLFAASAASVFADKVSYDGLTYSDITVNGYRNGALSVSLKGEERFFDLDKVQWIDLDNAPQMIQAEKSRNDSDPKPAIAFYKQAIHTLDDPDLKLLAELRAIAPTDAGGKWLDALSYFLDVYHASPTPDVWKFCPTHIPAGGSTMLTDSASLIDRKLADFESEDAKKNLRTLQLQLYTKAGDPRADALARELSGLPTGPEKKADPIPPTEDALIAPIESALKSGDYGGAIKLADAQLSGASDSLAIQLYQLKARAYVGQNNPDEAAASLLRISTFYPSSAEAPAALLVAADLQKRQNHADEAKRLYNEITEKYPDSPAAIRARGG